MLSRVPVHHHQNQPPTVGSGRVCGGVQLSVSPPPPSPTPPPSPPAPSLALLQRETKTPVSLSLSLSQLPDCFYSCEQTNRVWAHTKENAGAHLILLPQGVAPTEGLVIGQLLCGSSRTVRESWPDYYYFFLLV